MDGGRGNDRGGQPPPIRMSAIHTRTNEEWVEDLSQPGPRRDAALNDLRAVLENGLRRGLIGQVDTSAPEFESLADDFVPVSYTHLTLPTNREV